MKHEDSHLSDEQLLLEVEGELSDPDEGRVRAHLDACWHCRVRRQGMETAIADFVRVHQREFEGKLPPADGPRALLKARLAELSAAGIYERRGWFTPRGRFAWAAAICGLAAVALFLVSGSLERWIPSPQQAAIVSIPDSNLTPGATLLVSRGAVCTQSGANNKAVPVALQRKVFEEYGLVNADPRAYEVDYLVTPALGGADDIHNLWPHSQSHTVWNAQVKDALEGRLREMVCDGELDLTEAQREIAANWIAAYKKYFHTNEPLMDQWK